MSKNKLTTPIEDGYIMPSEFSQHEATIIIWPERAGTWQYSAKKVRPRFVEIISELIKHENVYVIASKSCYENAVSLLPKSERIKLLNVITDDSWARDVAPTFVSNKTEVRGVNWSFNAWGGKFDGLYASWENDDAFAKAFCKMAGYKCYDASPFVLEGGSIHSDGEGTILTSKCCLLSKGRNPNLSQAEIEDKLKIYLGAKKVVWIDDGIYNDETNGHIDNMAAFIAPCEVVLAWTDNQSDEQYELSKRAFEQLSNQTDANGRKFIIHKLPIPDYPVFLSEEDVLGYVFEAGEDEREVGERLAASYVNFYFANDCLLLPQFGGKNANSDKRAVEIMTKLCPDRKIIPISAYDILCGGGNIHCITQQIPKTEKI